MNNKTFKIFLGIYLIFFLYHSLTGFTLSGVIGLIVGLSVAFIAHAKKSHFTTALLLAHILIEWVEYSKHGLTYSSRELVMYGIHTFLDFVFLWQTLKRPVREYVVGGLAIGIVCLIITTKREPIYAFGQKMLVHHHEPSFLEMIVVGGIIGCTVAHIVEKKKNE